MFGTVEDLFTQSFVLPYLTSMLENAGATILIPRERDTQIHEIIIDNDRSTPGSEYKELDGEKAWSDGEKAGFGHIQATYTNGENPFTQGTYRQTVTQRKGKESLIEWIPEIPESGNYAVYASYQSFRTAQSRHCIPSIMPEGKPQSPSIKQWGVGLGSIWETSNSRHMNKPMRESY